MRSVVGFAGALVLIVGVVAMVLSAMRPTSDQEAAWFGGVAAGLALVAIVAAGVTIWFALPDYYARVIAQPAPEVWLQLRSDPAQGEWRDIAKNEVVPLGDATVRLRAHVRNAGQVVLRWGILNIQVPIGCDVQPVASGSPQMSHHRATTEFVSRELYPGRSVPCWCTVAERDYPPDHSFLYVVDVTVPGPGLWPIAAVLDGAGPQPKRAWTRVVLEVPDPSAIAPGGGEP